MPSNERHVILNGSKAVEIYQRKLALMHPKTFKDCLYTYRWSTRGASAKVSVAYGVSPKAVRDIWNHLTWKYDTMHLWQYDKYVSREIFRPDESTLGPLDDPFHADWPYWK